MGNWTEEPTKYQTVNRNGDVKDTEKIKVGVDVRPEDNQVDYMFESDEQYDLVVRFFESADRTTQVGSDVTIASGVAGGTQTHSSVGGNDPVDPPTPYPQFEVHDQSSDGSDNASVTGAAFVH